MHEINNGNMDQRIGPGKYSSEFLEINNTFNGMLDQIQQLKIDVYEQQLERQKIQLQHLQLQINPLCDIEMPQETGLELLAWVRENAPGTVSALLTCHASFQYAQRAIALGCSDYLLKPVIKRELGAFVQKAVSSIAKKSETERYVRLGQNWVGNSDSMIRSFWEDICSYAVSPNRRSVENTLATRQIGFSAEMKVIPILVQVREWKEGLSVRDAKRMEFALKNSAAELILQGEGSGVAFGRKDGQIILLRYLNSDSMCTVQDINQLCTELIAIANSYLVCDLCCFFANAVHIYELGDAVAELDI